MYFSVLWFYLEKTPFLNNTSYTKITTLPRKDPTHHTICLLEKSFCLKKNKNKLI